MYAPFQERDRENDLEQLRMNNSTLDHTLSDKIASLARAEDIIEQLTAEINNTQDDLNKALDKLSECDRQITKYKDQVALLQQEVCTVHCVFSNLNALLCLGVLSNPTFKSDELEIKSWTDSVYFDHFLQIISTIGLQFLLSITVAR